MASDHGAASELKYKHVTARPPSPGRANNFAAAGPSVAITTASQRVVAPSPWSKVVPSSRVIGSR